MVFCVRYLLWNILVCCIVLCCTVLYCVLFYFTLFYVLSNNFCYALLGERLCALFTTCNTNNFFMPSWVRGYVPSLQRVIQIIFVMPFWMRGYVPSLQRVIQIIFLCPLG